MKGVGGGYALGQTTKKSPNIHVRKIKKRFPRKKDCLYCFRHNYIKNV